MIVEKKTWPKRQLQIECKQLSDRLLWSNTLDRGTIYLSPLKLDDWIALLMTRYHGEVVELIHTLPYIDRFFYQAKVNRFKQLSIWCIREECYYQAILDSKAYRDYQIVLLAEKHLVHADSEKHQRNRSQNLL